MEPTVVTEVLTFVAGVSPLICTDFEMFSFSYRESRTPSVLTVFKTTSFANVVVFTRTEIIWNKLDFFCPIFCS